MPGAIVALVKPQFEAGRDDVPRGGVVTDPATWERVLREVAASAETAGLQADRAIRSPITGGDGNVEFLVDIRRHRPEGFGTAIYGESIVAAVSEDRA